MAKICLIGAGSLEWAHVILTDLMCVFEDRLEIRLHDLNLKRARLVARWAKKANEKHKRQDVFRVVSDRRKALAGADGAIISIATGGYEAMAADLEIPEKYGIYATVGDTSGPGGWARALRNIPTFEAFAKDFAEICPTAFIVNLTNPMAALTAAIQLNCPNPCVGLCHAYFETRDLIQRIFGLPGPEKIAFTFAGMNHFTWVIDLRIGREDGYEKLRKKLQGKPLWSILSKRPDDGLNMPWNLRLCADLYDTHGYLTLPGDRHTCEFLSYLLSGKTTPDKKPERGLTAENLERYDIERTVIADRQKSVEPRLQRYKDWISGKQEFSMERSRETAADMIRAYLRNEPFTGPVNVLNKGQIPGLPEDACVETLGTVDGVGVHPFVVDGIPEFMLETMRPHANCQKWITEGVLEANWEKLLQALYHDPCCASLRPDQIRQMAKELLKANAEFLPPRLRRLAK
jgi:alpha-galactosidase